jgi:CBS domain-containing protein
MPTLEEIMSRDVYVTPRETSVADVAKAMVKGRFGSALVTTGSMLTGIFTERDVLRAAASGSVLTSSPISEWMTRDPETAEPDTEAEDALEMMLSGGFRHLPVLSGSAVVGVVSLRDVLGSRIRRPSS